MYFLTRRRGHIQRRRWGFDQPTERFGRVYSAPATYIQFDNAVAPVSAYKGDVSLLAAPDRFVKEVILCVPDFSARLAVLEFLYLLPDELAVIHRRLDIISATTVEIKTSQRLATLLLDVVLPLGNRLNLHTRKPVVGTHSMFAAVWL